MGERNRGKIMEAKEEIRFWKGEAKFWRDAFATARELREDAEGEVREQRAIIQRLEDKLWLVSGGY